MVMSEADPAEHRGGSRLERLAVQHPVAATWLVLIVPLVLAVASLRQPRWYPLLDQAVIELRIRDVWSSDPPLLGIYGRLGPPGREASHPGPLSFYALWPMYQLFGATAWAMQAASACLHAAAIAVALWIAHRRGGVTLVLATGAVLGVLARFYGPFTLTDPWTPYLPMLWWFVFLLAAWSVACGDLPLLPVTVLAGTFCTQAHAGYAGLTVGLGGLAFAAATFDSFGRRHDGRAPRAAFVRWTLLAAALGALAWAPPLIEELTERPGNLAKLREYFGNPPETPIGLRDGIELLLAHLDLRTIVAGRLGPSDLIDIGSPVPGIVMLVVWLVAVRIAWSLGHRALLRMHLVVAGAILLALVTMSRIFGVLWNYLVPWAWGTLGLMVVAVGWTAGAWRESRATAPATISSVRMGRAALAGIIAVSTFTFAADAARVQIIRPDLSAIMDEIVPRTAKALGDGTATGGGKGGRYLISWTDPTHLGTQGWALLNELERRGFDVGAEEVYGATVRPRRVMSRNAASAVVVLATGEKVEAWRSRPGVEEVAYVDLRNQAERAEYERLRATAVSDLQAAGQPELSLLIDENPWAVRFHPKASEGVRAAIIRMADIGVPTAVFVGSPDAVTLD